MAKEIAPKAHSKRRVERMLTFILPVFLLIALVAVLPIWRHSKKWSFYPLGGLSLLILIVLFLFWTGRF
jgi:membrane protein YdbS with pleckstrin-like domain